jgi:hypothetical protein
MITKSVNLLYKRGKTGSIKCLSKGTDAEDDGSYVNAVKGVYAARFPNKLAAGKALIEIHLKTTSLKEENNTIRDPRVTDNVVAIDTRGLKIT